MRFITRVLRILALLTPAASFAATPPYPASTVITAMNWDFDSVRSLRKAQGSDLWPLTWGVDGNLYGAWGDGGGFDGDSNNIGRVSLGFARVSGVPAPGQPASFSGRNLWGAAPAYAQNAATFGGKVSEMISVGGVLYAYGAPWTRENCNCANPVDMPGVDSRQHTVMWSADLGRSWQLAAWRSGRGPGGLLQYGRDYSDAPDPRHVYFYFQGDPGSDASHLYLRRIGVQNLRANPDGPGISEYFAGLSSSGSPVWSASPAAARAVFNDPAVPSGTGAGAHVVHDPHLQRYLLSTFHGDATGQIGFFEAPSPWGPWATVAYYEDWGGFNESAGSGNGLLFPAKWISGDGTGLWAVFSGKTNGFDSFNVARVRLTLSAGGPAVSPDPAPVGYWSCNEDGGTVAHDESGHGNGAALVHGVRWTDGAAGSGLWFAGGSNAVVVPPSASLANLYRHGLTVAAWVNVHAPGASTRLLDKDANSVGWFLKLDGTTLQFTADQFTTRPLTRLASVPLQRNTWQHIAMTWDGSAAGSGVHLYVDGVQSDGQAADGAGIAADDASVPLTMGNRAVDLQRGFEGALDEVRIYDQVLDPAQIRALSEGP